VLLLWNTANGHDISRIPAAYRKETFIKCGPSKRFRTKLFTHHNAFATYFHTQNSMN